MTEDAELIFPASGQQALARPHAIGGKDWESVYYSSEDPVDRVFIGNTAIWPVPKRP